MTFDLNKLIGIKFGIGREDLARCDCVGICWLYHKLVHGKDYPHRDGKPLVFRDKKKDLLRILSVIKTWAHEVKFEELKEGDIILLSTKGIGALGVVTPDHKVLYMNETYGSSLVKKEYVKEYFITAFRPNQ